MFNVLTVDAMFALMRTVFRADVSMNDEEKKTVKENLAAIYLISEQCDMAHLVGYALEQNGLIDPSSKYFEKFQEQEYLAIIRAEGMEYELDNMRRLFEEHGIRFIPLKGAVIRPMYPEGWMRTSSDVDVLVHRDDFDRAERLVIDELGYKKGGESGHDHSFHSDGGVHIELHFDLIEDSRAFCAKEILSGVWDGAHPVSDGSCEHAMLDEMFY